MTVTCEQGELSTDPVDARLYVPKTALSVEQNCGQGVYKRWRRIPGSQGYHSADLVCSTVSLTGKPDDQLHGSALVSNHRDGYLTGTLVPGTGSSQP